MGVLKKGVQLHVFPSTKFKTVTIKLYFKSPLTIDNITKRSLVARLLETNSQEYPTQTAFQKALAKLYGASFSTNITRIGNIHQVGLTLTIVNDKYLSVDTVTTEAFDFLASILHYPRIEDGQFHEATFKREASNLKEELLSLSDNKSAYATQRVKEVYFSDPRQATNIDGSLEAIDQLTAEDVFKTYQSMLTSDQVDIFVLGDVEEKSIIQLVNRLNLNARTSIETSPFYIQNQIAVKRVEEIQSVKQSKLNMVYNTGVYYQDDYYIAAQVLNGIFGGFPHSKLFMNIREKESLAYHISSHMDFFRGVMYVRAGIDHSKVDHAITKITQQLEAILADQFSDESIVQTKEMLKNSLCQSDDNPNAVINREHLLQVVKKDLTLDDWMRCIDQVSRQEIIMVAKQIKLCSIYVLKGAE